jgi:hypothetical protein
MLKLLIRIARVFILRRKVLESLVIDIPPQQLPSDPSAYLFRPPIHLVVLSIEVEQVKLGVYADPFLTFQQGPPPNAAWRQRWQCETLFFGDKGNDSWRLCFPQALSSPCTGIDRWQPLWRSLRY